MTFDPKAFRVDEYLGDIECGYATTGQALLYIANSAYHAGLEDAAKACKRERFTGNHLFFAGLICALVAKDGG